MYPSPLKRLFTTACLPTPRSPHSLRVGASDAASGRRKMLRQAHAIRKLCLHLRTSLGTGNEKSRPREGTPVQAPHEFKHPRRNPRTLATKPKKATGYIPPSAATVVICFQILTFAVAATVEDGAPDLRGGCDLLSNSYLCSSCDSEGAHITTRQGL